MSAKAEPVRQERVMFKDETWTTRCPEPGCRYFMAAEHSICDACLFRKFVGSMSPEASGCCSCVEAGYTREQVERILRWAIGERVVTPYYRKEAR